MNVMDATSATEKDAQGLAVWLGEQGIPASICDVFEGNTKTVLVVYRQRFHTVLFFQHLLDAFKEVTTPVLFSCVIAFRE